MASQSELPKKLSGWKEIMSNNENPQLDSNRQRDLYIRTLCQKVKGSIETKQRPIKMDSRTIYRALSSKRTPFQTGTDEWSHLWKVPRGRWISQTCPMWLWGYSSFTISSPGPVLHGTKWLIWRPHKQSPTFHSKCGINTGLIKKKASTTDEWRSWCRGRMWATPYRYIHTYLHAYIHTYIHTYMSLMQVNHLQHLYLLLWNDVDCKENKVIKKNTKKILFWVNM
jgi:hypothetical protein